MNPTSLPFEYPFQWDNESLREGAGVTPEGAAILKQRDRDLEDFLATLGGGGGAPPTVFVAASDASEASRAMAHYTCDGTDDQEQINAALAECSTLGFGRVLLSEGNFSISAAVGDLPPDVALQGLGKTVTKLNQIGASANVVFIGSTFSGTGASISDMTLDATGITDGGYGLVLGGDRTRVERVRMVGLGLQNYANIDYTGSYGVFRDCDFIEPGVSGAAGIALYEAHCKVIDNYFYDIPGAAVMGDTPAPAFSIVTGNDIEWSQSDNVATDSIIVGANAIVVGNVCQDNRGSPATITAGAGSQVANNVLL